MASVGVSFFPDRQKAEERPRAFAFVDGMNLFNAVKTSFGYTYPNYDVRALAGAVCDQYSWSLHATYFYTGLPSSERDPSRHGFWIAKLAHMARNGVSTFQRRLRYDPDPPYRGHEKGVDVRIALDIVRYARERAFDVALIFSQDQDLSEAVLDVYAIAKEQQRFITVASAFPPNGKRAINRCKPIQFGRELYDACIDPRDYRPRAERG